MIGFATGDPRSSDLTSQTRNAKLPADCFTIRISMSKKTQFTDALKYGKCAGTGHASTFNGDGSCQHNSVGHAPRTCGYNYDKTCNCCELCRNNCIMLRIIKDSAKEQASKMAEELTKLREKAERYEEAKITVDKLFGRYF